MFDSLFGKSNDGHVSFWKNLTSIEQLNEIASLSAEKPVVIFKHSTRCSISRMALKQFERDFDLQHRTEPYLLDLLAYREVSNEIAGRFGVQHQSPQILLVADGKVIYHDSHSDIDAGTLKKYI